VNGERVDRADGGRGSLIDAESNADSKMRMGDVTAELVLLTARRAVVTLMIRSLGICRRTAKGHSGYS
jgi:hypothetical protein